MSSNDMRLRMMFCFDHLPLWWDSSITCFQFPCLGQPLFFTTFRSAFEDLETSYRLFHSFALLVRVPANYHYRRVMNVTYAFWSVKTLYRRDWAMFGTGSAVNALLCVRALYIVAAWI